MGGEAAGAGGRARAWRCSWGRKVAPSPQPGGGGGGGGAGAGVALFYPGSGAWGAARPGPPLGSSRAGPAATPRSGLCRCGCRGRALRSGPSAPRGSGAGGRVPGRGGSGGTPRCASGRQAAPCGSGSARRENGAFVTLWGRGGRAG